MMFKVGNIVIKSDTFELFTEVLGKTSIIMGDFATGKTLMLKKIESINKLSM